MKIISHRGNIDGFCQQENSPNQIHQALQLGIGCEVDIWAHKGKLGLGHDYLQYEITEDFLHHKDLWIHAKNLEALNWLYTTKLNYFWHESDKATITSHGYIWCYPSNYVENGITVLSTRYEKFDEKILGICTDYPVDFLK
jgi:hypothetical protein